MWASLGPGLVSRPLSFPLSTLCPAAALAAPALQRRHQRISWRRPLNAIPVSGRSTNYRAAGPCPRTSPSLRACAHSASTAAWPSARARRRTWMHAPAAGGAQRCPSAAAGSGSVHSAESGPKLSKPEIERLLREAAAVVSTAHLLVAADLGGFNAALIIWKALAAVPLSERHRLLDVLTSEDIVRLWRFSAQRYNAGAGEALAAMGVMYNMLDDFPDRPGEVFTYDGRAAMPNGLRLKVVDRFQKVFFTGDDPEELYGRVLLGKGPLVDAVYPLYFHVSLQPSIVPATNEITDVQLEYLAPEAIPLSRDEIPRWAWPNPGPQRWPFSGGLTDHMRAVGPGCWVGVGWKAPRPGVDVGRRFFTFMLVRRIHQE